ncbi:MAG: response regulator transcription factor [Clostridia bacterium]|nr:response regulator transcription factor [Clostridia bacterium]
MRILVAEDEIALASALKKIFEKSNYSADVVHNGVDAIEYIKSGNYDAVILDLMMPELDGMEVIKRVRAAKNDIPILVLSAKTEIDDIVLGLDSGANDYMPKPFDARELVARVRAMTRVQTSTNDSKLCFGNVTLDRATYKLSTENGSIRLANKEFQIMEMLLKNPGHVITSDRLMERIWGLDGLTEMNVIWVYISYLRRKLLTLGADITIKSIRNSGYTVEMAEEDNV